SKQQTLINRLVSVHPTLNLHWGPGWKFKRARRLKPDEWLQTVSDIIWRTEPSPQTGRANAAGVPMMYLADRRDTALREGRVDSSYAAIAEFEIRPKCSVYIAPVGELAQIARSGRGFLSGDVSATL